MSDPSPRHYCYQIKFKYHWDNQHALLIQECLHPQFQYAKISRFHSDAEEGSIYIRYKVKRCLSVIIKTFKTLSVYPILASKFPFRQGQAEFIEYGTRAPHIRTVYDDKREDRAESFKLSIIKRKREPDVIPPTLVLVDMIVDE